MNENLFPQDIELMHTPYIKLGRDFLLGEENEIVIQVGRIPHPMEENHYIEWIEVWQDGELLRREEFNPTRDKEAKIYLVLPKSLDKNKKLVIKAYCNLHGLYQTELDLNHLESLEVEKEY